MEGLSAGWFTMTIVDRYPLEQAAGMLKHLESRQVAGKLLLAVKE